MQRNRSIGIYIELWFADPLANVETTLEVFLIRISCQRLFILETPTNYTVILSTFGLEGTG